MAENLNDNNQLNSARAVKPGLLSVDMSKFGNLTQEEASFETMDKVQGISDKLDDIQKTLDDNGQVQSVAREGFGAVLTSMGRMSEGMSRSGSAIYTQTDRIARSLEDLINGVSNSFGEIRDILRNMPKGSTLQSGSRENISEAEIVRPREAITRTPPLPIIDLSGIGQIAPAITMSMDGVARRIGEGMSSIASQIVSATRLSIESAVSGTKLVPQLEYVGSGANTASGGMSALIPELVEERGNTWSEFESTSWADSVEKSLQVVSTGVVAVGAVLRQLVGIEQNRDIQAQYRYQLALQAPVRQQVAERARERDFQITMEMPKAVKGIAEWLLGLIGLHKETVATVMAISGAVLNSLKWVANWFLGTGLGKALIYDISKLWQWVRVNTQLALRGSEKSWFGWIGRGINAVSQALAKSWQWVTVNARLALRGSEKSWFGWIGRGINAVTQFFATHFPRLTGWISGLSSFVTRRFAGVTAWFTKTFGKGAGKAFPLLGAIIAGVEAVRRFMEGDYLGSILEVIAGIASFFPGLGTVISVGLSVVNILRDFGMGKGITDAVNGFISDTAKSVWGFIRDSFVSIGMFISDIWNTSINWISDKFNSVTEWVSEVTKPYVDGFMELYNWVSEWVVVLTDTTIGTIKDAWYGLYNSFTAASEFIWEGITSLASSVYETVRYYIKDWFGIDITKVFTDLYNGISAVWGIAKLAIMSAPGKLSEYWEKIKTSVSNGWKAFVDGAGVVLGYVKEGLLAIPGVISFAWDIFTTPIKGAWNILTKGLSVAKDAIVKGFDLFKSGVDSIAKWIESIDPWKEIENGIKKLGDLLRAIPNALKRVYNNAIDAIPGASKLFSKYELPNENVASEPPAPEEVSLTSMVSNSAEIGRNIAIHERTLKELADAKKELAGTSSIFSPYQVEALKSKVWELEQRSEREEKILNTYYGKDAWKDLKGTAQTKAEVPAVSGIPTTAKEKIEMERAIHKQIAKERAEHIDEINVLNRQMEEAYNSDWGNTRVSGTVQAGTVMHAQASALPEIKAEAPEISAQPMEMQRMEPTTVTPNVSVLPMEPTTVTPNVSVLPSVPVQVPAEKMSELTQPPPIEGMKIPVAVPQQPVTNKNAEMLVSMMEKQIAENGKTLGKCAQAFNDATISLGMASERGHAYQKIAQLDKNKNFEDITSQYKTAEDLKNLPRGAVVVWDKSAEKEYGHVSVALGDGREISDHVQNQIIGADSKGRRYGAYHVFMPKADISASTEEKGIFARMGDSISNWFRGENDNEDLALRENTEAIRANTDASKEQGGISKLLTGALDIMNKGLQGGAKGAGAALMKAEELLFSNSSIFDPNSILAAKPSGTMTVSSLSMMGEGSGRSFITEAVAEDSTEPVESPLPQTIANQQAEEQRQRELSQRPVTVVAPAVNAGQNESPVPQPTMNDAYIDDIRLLAINQGLV